MVLTDIEFPMEIKWLLSLGGKFALPIQANDFPLLDIIVDMEECIKNMEDERQKEITRARVTNILSKLNTNLNEFDRTIIKIHDDCSKFLKDNKQIIIVKADKGGATVAMLLDDYKEKMTLMLSDTTTYELQARNPLTKLEAASNALVNRMYTAKVIDEPQRKSMTRHNSQLSRIYALPKIHKDGAPLRPIVSTVNSPSAVLSKYMDGLLKCLANDKYNVKTSHEIKTRLNGVSIARNDVLVSFDIVALFPSIPINLVMDILERKWDIICKHTCMPKDLFLDTMRFILIDSPFFVFGDTMYKQIDGCAMGNNISPTIADIITNELFDVILPKLKFNIKFLAKYVDDIVAIIPSRKAEEMLMMLNSFQERIQFTMEVEQDDRLPYLDLLLVREGNTIITDWYRKSTASNTTLNFLSNHPLQMRKNVAYNMFLRAIGLSDIRFHQANINRVRAILLENSFPSHIIAQQMHKST